MNWFRAMIRGALRRAYGPFEDFWYRAMSPNVKSGVAVDEVTALSFSAVFACIRILSNTVGFLPCHLYQKTDGGKRRKSVTNSLSRLFTLGPNPEMTAFRFKQLLEGHLCAWGNAFSYVERDRAGRVLSLWPLRPDRMEVRRNKQSTELEYIYRGNQTGAVELGRDEVWHIPGFGYDGLTGFSIIRLAQEAVGLGLAAEEFGSRFFGNGTNPGLIAMHPKRLNPDTLKALQASLTKAYSGLGKSHKMLVLEEGMTVDKLGIPPEDAQFLQTRKFQVVEICRFYGVPPHKVAELDRATFSNIEHQGIEFVTDSILPWVTLWAQDMGRYFLTEAERDSLYWEFNVDALQRGDFATRSTGYATAVSNGWMSRNEVRKMENRDPIEGEGGDIYTVQLAMVDLKDIANGRAVPRGPAGLPDEEEQGERGLTLVRSVAGRDRVARAYYGLMRRAADEIVTKEARAITKALERNVRDGKGKDAFLAWLNEFYAEIPAYIRKKLDPVWQSFGEAVYVEAGAEIGIDGAMTDSIRAWLRRFAERYIERHIGSSVGQLQALAEEDMSLIEKRAAEWQETRADKIATNETVRLSSGLSQQVWFGAGFASVWGIRGGSTCPYCRSLEGRRIREGQSYVNDGQTIEPGADKTPMKIRGTKKHPPLHEGCDCFLYPG